MLKRSHRTFVSCGSNCKHPLAVDATDMGSCFLCGLRFDQVNMLQ